MYYENREFITTCNKFTLHRWPKGFPHTSDYRHNRSLVITLFTTSGCFFSLSSLRSSFSSRLLWLYVLLTGHSWNKDIRPVPYFPFLTRTYFVIRINSSKIKLFSTEPCVNLRFREGHLSSKLFLSVLASVFNIFIYKLMQSNKEACYFHYKQYIKNNSNNNS